MRSRITHVPADPFGVTSTSPFSPISQGAPAQIHWQNRPQIGSNARIRKKFTSFVLLARPCTTGRPPSGARDAHDCSTLDQSTPNLLFAFVFCIPNMRSRIAPTRSHRPHSVCGVLHTYPHVLSHPRTFGYRSKAEGQSTNLSSFGFVWTVSQ